MISMLKGNDNGFLENCLGISYTNKNSPQFEITKSLLSIIVSQELLIFDTKQLLRNLICTETIELSLIFGPLLKNALN
jgi:hypothetical protein